MAATNDWFRAFIIGWKIALFLCRIEHQITSALLDVGNVILALVVLVAVLVWLEAAVTVALDGKVRLCGQGSTGLSGPKGTSDGLQPLGYVALGVLRVVTAPRGLVEVQVGRAGLDVGVAVGALDIAVAVGRVREQAVRFRTGQLGADAETLSP